MRRRTGRATTRGAGAAVLLVGAAATLTGCASNAAITDYAGVPVMRVLETREVTAGGSEGDGDQEAGEVEGALEDEQGGAQDVRFVERELEVEPGQAAATYLENGVKLAVVLWGSSTCPPVGERMHVLPDEPNAVRIDLREIPQDRPCTMDLVPHTTVFGTKTSTVEPLVIHVGDETIELPVK
ncbi:hypothetical protein [Cellulomonas sp. B6]|uniref:hypothetical protein n=1 Tax=Cellulomonas sp. B6 TaxID=1295626 RepID=UPI0012373534|nr:hypothetical protein [Cellulomonas sp. B6]